MIKKYWGGNFFFDKGEKGVSARCDFEQRFNVVVVVVAAALHGLFQRWFFLSRRVNFYVEYPSRKMI